MKGKGQAINIASENIGNFLTTIKDKIGIAKNIKMYMVGEMLLD